MATRQIEKIFKPGPLIRACHAPSGQRIKPVVLFKNRRVTLYSMAIGPRHWKKISEQEFVCGIVIPDITAAVLKNQGIIAFLDGNIDVVKLPFVLYQQGTPLEVSAAIKSKKIMVSVKGRFVINVHSALTFNIFVFHGKSSEEVRELDTSAYAGICLAYGIKH